LRHGRAAGTAERGDTARGPDATDEPRRHRWATPVAWARLATACPRSRGRWVTRCVLGDPVGTAWHGEDDNCEGDRDGLRSPLCRALRGDRWRQGRPGGDGAGTS